MQSEIEPGDWVPVGGSATLAPGTVIPVTVHDTDIAVWRGESGAVHAWHSQCPHRGMRLSAGFVRGDRLGCLYHGWQYGGSGQCEVIPAHPDLEPPKAVCAKTFHAEDRDGLIWVSLAELPEPVTSIGDLYFCTSIFVDASTAHIAAAQGSVEESVVLAVQPMTESRSGIHVLTDAGDAPNVRLQYARWARRFRWSLENDGMTHANSTGDRP